MTINSNTPALASNSHRWWEATDEKIAGALSGAAQEIEKFSWDRRFLNMTCTRYITGRDTVGPYAYSMARRPAQLARRWSGLTWQAPTDNVIAICADVFKTRIWKERPFILVVPQAGNFKARVKAKKLSRFIDAVFSETRFWDSYEMCGMDAMTCGTAFVKVHESLTEKRKVSVSRVHPDEILLNEDEEHPRSLIQRCFVHVEEAITKYGDTPQLRDAIWKAPRAFPGIYFGGGLNASDVVPMTEGWHLAGWNSQTDEEIDGKTVVSINNVLLDAREWKPTHFPFARLLFDPLADGYFGQGLAEKLLPYQAELNRYDEADWENQRRMSWPRWLNPIGSQVGAAHLAGKSAAVINHAPNLKPEAVFPESINPLAEQRRERISRSAFRRAGISENAAMGEKPSGINSGVGLMAWSTLDDKRHADVGQRGEQFVTDVANLIFELAEEIEPKVRLPGREMQEIDWSEAKLANNLYAARAFPMSRLPQMPAARFQTIANWYADGQIDKQTKMRLEQVPDTEGHQDLASSALDDIQACLDAIIEDGDYNPPEPFQDLATALPIAQSRWLQERHRKTPEDRLNLLLQWIMQCDELVSEGAPPVGIQPPQGMIAPSPGQVAPAQSPPMALPAAA